MGLDAGIETKDRQEVIYWRKANAIHQWFVDNVQNGNDDCGRYEVTIPQLRDLLEVCEEVIRVPDLAEELLPTQSGFIFGSTDYDEWYFDNVKETHDCLSEVVKKTPLEATFIYWSSW